MGKRAVFVGINDYPFEDLDLKGCVNDARAWGDLLANHYDFPRSSIRLITDVEATKKNVVAGLKRLLARAKAGDVLAFGNSSHGSQVPDADGDEGYLDEVLCPYDCEVEQVRDDELRDIFDQVPRGVRLTVILDNCHSGTGTRVAVGAGSVYRRARAIPPQRAGAPAGWTPFGKKASPGRPESSMREILLAGCEDGESSYDAGFDGTFHGAMTYTALRAIEDAKYKITYDELARRVRRRLAAAEFDQHPQLEGTAANKRRQIFT